MRSRFPLALLLLVVLLILAFAAPAAPASPGTSGADPLALLAVQSAELTITGGAAGDYYGYSVALDGDTALVGAHGRSSWQGAAYVFTRGGGAWTQQQELTASDGVAGDTFGWSVALDGDTALIGAYNRSSARGAAYVFTRSGATWTQQGEALTTGGAAANDNFGFSVALDGDTALIGASGRSSARGAAYVFTRFAAVWAQQQELTADDGAAGDLFGITVALDGDTAVAGAWGRSSNQGAAYVFTRSGSTWAQQGVAITAADGGAEHYFGRAVAVDGDTALVGANGKDSIRGAAYVFTRSGTTWTQQQELTASDRASYDNFGYSVALDGDTALLGANGDDSVRGAAYLFTRSGTSWAQQQKLTASDGAAGDEFGSSVALDGDSALVGAPFKASFQGAAYVFAPPALAITSVTPSSAKRGASVTVSGSGFGDAQGTSSVSFGGTACGEYASWSDAGITCTVPAGAALGAQHVTVTTSAGSSDPSSFTVLPYDEPTVSISGGGSGWSGSAVDLTATATVDSLLAPASLEYSTDGGTTWTEIPGTGTIRTLSISDAGETTVWVRATDSADQTATAAANVKIDNQTPTVTVSGSDDAWHAGPVTLAFTPAAGPSGVAGVEYRLGEGSWTTVEMTAGAYKVTISQSGATTVSYRATSGAGLASDSAAATVRIDTVKPKAKARKVVFKRGAVAMLKLNVAKQPAGCGKAKVTVKVYKGAKLKKSFTTTYLTVNKWQTVRCTKLKKLARGTYVMKLQAVDQIGNRQSGWTKATLVVK